MPKAMQGENDAALAADMSLPALFGLKGKVALVSGGGSGIGAMIVTGLARNGVKVYCVSRKDTSEFASSFKEGNVVALQCDVGEPSAVAKLMSEIKQREGQLHIVVNNAGTNWNAPVEKHTMDAWDKVMTVNTRSIFNVTQQALPLLKAAASKGDPARIINISSINGIRPAFNMDTFAYSASKAAVIRLSEHLASRLGKHNITVNTICPGPFESRMMRGTLEAAGADNVASATTLRRLGYPEDMAGSVVFLSSRAGSYITGATLVVDGGSLVSSFSKL